LQLIPHVKAPVTDLPVKQVIGHVDLTLPYGRVIHDYMGSK
jgi:acetoacetate decarboxylase